jgi:hypothetical protein
VEKARWDSVPSLFVANNGGLLPDKGGLLGNKEGLLLVSVEVEESEACLFALSGDDVSGTDVGDVELGGGSVDDEGD